MRFWDTVFIQYYMDLCHINFPPDSPSKKCVFYLSVAPGTTGTRKLGCCEIQRKILQNSIENPKMVFLLSKFASWKIEVLSSNWKIFKKRLFSLLWCRARDLLRITNRSDDRRLWTTNLLHTMQLRNTLGLGVAYLYPLKNQEKGFLFSEGTDKQHHGLLG